MAITNVVLYTDKLAEVRAFYEDNFRFTYETEVPDGFGIAASGTAYIFYLDANIHGKPPTSGAFIRINNPHPELEQNRLTEAGLAVSEIREEYWGSIMGELVRYCEIVDPAGNTLQLFRDHIVEIKNFTLKRDL